ncbi:MAG TPA: histidine kinase [Steroidobacteraceae bacterium]|jgi:hypothetical protein|nr:histidine kinase [Steroidobacteraceae bacterium]
MSSQSADTLRPPDTAHRLIGGRLYYASTLAAWSLYGLVQYGLSPAPQRLAVAAGAAAWCGSGLLGTHLLAWLAQRRRWYRIPQLLAPFAVGALLLSAAMNLARAAVGVWFGDAFRQSPYWVVLAHYVQGLLVVAVWCAVVLAVNEVKHRRAAETEALRLALLAQTSQLNALRSQLNPHFLFNCLNGLRELIDADRDRARQVVELLAGLLRYTLRADRVATVSLAEELGAVEDYLALERVRFDERLRVRLNIDPRSTAARLPPMLLQTLVENGVKHGIARLPAGGELTVVAAIVAGSLHIQVTNPGKLSHSAAGPPAVGLDNARERLRLMYGDGASLRLDAGDEFTVRAQLVIPLHPGGLRS